MDDIAGTIPELQGPQQKKWQLNVHASRHIHWYKRAETPPPKKNRFAHVWSHSSPRGAEFFCGFCGGLLRMREGGGRPTCYLRLFLNPHMCVAKVFHFPLPLSFPPHPYQPFHPPTPLGGGRATKVNFPLSLLFRIPPPPPLTETRTDYVQ